MMNSYITSYIEQLSNDNVIDEVFVTSSDYSINKIYKVKPNKIFAPQYFIAFSNDNHEDIEKKLYELEEINKQNNNKKMPYLLFVPLSDLPKNLTYFNGVLYVHLILFDINHKKIFYDKNSHYFGIKYINNAIEIFKSIVEKADDSID